MSKKRLEEKRPTWDEVWMRFAFVIAERSYDPGYRVGTVIVSEDNTQVLSVGYNGNYAGGPNKRESEDAGKSGFIHSELNALLKMDYNYPQKKKLYVTMSPCRHCAKAIINSGISEVIYHHEYRDLSGVELLRSVGIPCRKV